ncbi:MAG: acetyl-CoA carboxylase carboxyltransferase subunit alpha [Chitinophagales bacterium]
MQYLDFEKPIEELNEQLEKLKKISDNGKVDMASAVKEIEEKISETRTNIYSQLTGWQRVQLSRHPNRPYSLFYIQQMCTKFIELRGDRQVRDDTAMIGGLAMMDEEPIMFVGQQKGINTKDRQYRNFGMANPEGYRKALRLFKLAEKFNVPIVTLIDTPRAYPGLEAEERGQAEAIARNLYEMILMKVPVICIIIGEGASGGALGIGIGDRVLMLENTWYSVISPESCSSILWHSWDMKEEAAEQLKLTAQHMHQFKLVDGIIKEPMGGAHNNPEEMSKMLKREIKKQLIDLKDMTPAERIAARIRKFSSMGFYED